MLNQLLLVEECSIILDIISNPLCADTDTGI